MKKKLSIVMLVLLAAALIAALAACNPGRGNGGTNDPNEYEVGYYNVTFNPNGGTTAPEANLTNVRRGSAIDFPKNEAGELFKPTKRGYDFVYWEWTDRTGTTREFYFKGDASHTPDTITGNTTIRALYKAQEFTHTPSPRAGLEIVKDGDNVYYSINEEYYAENEVVLGSGDDVTFTSKYDAQTDFACPWIADENGAVDDSNKFCFWYYMTDKISEDDKPVYRKVGGGETTDVNEAMKDENDAPVRAQVPVQLTKWKDDSKDVVQSLDKYPLTNALTIYPMFEDNLPKVTVAFDGLDKSFEKRPTELINEKKDMEEINEYYKLNNLGGDYEFLYWYYQLTEGSGDDAEVVDYEFIFEAAPVVDEDGNETIPAGDKKPTDLRDATGNRGTFVPVTLTLYPKKARVVSVNELADLTKYAAKVKELIAAEQEILQKTEDKDYVLTEEEENTLRELEEYLSARIHVRQNVSGFGGEAAIFDADHPFKGVIDGETESGGSATIYYEKTSLTLEEGATIADASIFGHVEGEIRNLIVNAKIALSTTAGVTYYIAPLASYNYGKIFNVTVNFESISVSGGGRMIVGGICAVNSGTADETDKGRIENCSVTVGKLDADGVSDLLFGGVVGHNEASTNLVGCAAEITLGAVTDAANEGGALATIGIGGISGTNGGTVERCHANFAVKEASVSATAARLYVGGIAAESTGGIKQSYANIGAAKTESEDAEVLSVEYGGPTVAIGGIVGSNEGYLIDVYATSYVTLTIPEGSGLMTAYLAGLAADNSGHGKYNSNPTETSVGSISYSYATGSLLVNVAESRANVTTYVGGISGLQVSARLVNSFSATAIAVSCSEAEESRINVGYLFGKVTEKDGDEKLRNHLYYIDDNDGGGLMLNDKKYRQETVKDEDDKESTTSNFGTIYGELIASTDLTPSFLNDNDRLNFDSRETNGSRTWKYPEDGAEGVEPPVFPTL